MSQETGYISSFMSHPLGTATGLEDCILNGFVLFCFSPQLSRHLMLVRKFVFLPRLWQEGSGSNLGVKGGEDKC